MGRDKEIKGGASCENVEVREAKSSRIYHPPKTRKLIIREVGDLEGDEWLKKGLCPTSLLPSNLVC